MASNEDGTVPIESAGVRPTYEDPQRLPEPPRVERRIRLTATQAAGLAMVGLMPVLSFFGLFGLGRGTAEGGSGPVAVRVEYPSVQRHKVRQPLYLFVSNTSGAVLPTVELRLTREYVAAFSDVAFTPGPDEIEAEEYVFALTDLAPGETRNVWGEMQANAYWGHGATLAWRVLDEAGAETAAGALAFGTFVWP